MTFTTTEGTASATQTYTLSGSNLSGTNGILVTPPAGYEIGQGATPTYSTSAFTVAQTSTGTVAATTISVRLTNGTTVAGSPYNGVITHTSSGATQVDKTVTGTVTAAPSTTITTGAITPATIVAGNDVVVDYTSTGTFSGGNVFSAELSNASGSFASGTTALTTTGSTATSLTVTIPVATAAGSAYLIRVKGSSPATTGSASSNTLTVTAPPAVPVLTTTGVSAITSTSASSGGNITASSGSSVTARGVVYGPSSGGSPRLGGPGVVATSNGTGTGTFTSAISGLTPGASYIVAAYATNATGTGYGADANFTTTAAPAIGATTASPTSVYGGGSVVLTYSTSGTFNGGNAFTAELSDASGNFPGTVLTPTASTATTLTVTIPMGTAAGSSYTLRVLASNPATTGPASNAITVNAGVFEPFEQTSVGSGYSTSPTPFAEQSGTWTVFQGINGNSTSSDAFNGVRSVRLRGGGYAQYSKANGIGTISLNASLFGTTDTGVTFTLDYSLDNGTTFVRVPGTATTLSAPGLTTHSFANAPYSYTLNVTGTVLLRIGTTNTLVASSSPRIDIDDVTISDYVNPATRLTASPSSLTLSATTGQVASGTYTLVGQNLPTGTTVSLSSNDPTVLISVDGGTTYGTTATSAATPASGNLVQAVQVQYTATASTNATIANDIASLSLSAPVAVTATAVPIVSYTWTGASSTSWIDPTNWTPNRSTLSNTDVLVFNGSTTAAPTIDLDYTTAQTIGQLQFSNGVSATFTNTGNRTLNLSHLTSGADFILPAGTTLTVYNPSTSTTVTGLTIQLASGGKATIGGTLVFDALTPTTPTNTGTGAHRLLGTTANGTEFVSGSIFRAGVNFSGSAFGVTTTDAPANTVVFRSGARYEQLGGGNPFALTQPASITTLEAGSLFYVGPGITVPISMSGRTYGSLEYDLGTGITNNTSGASPVTIAGDLITTSGMVGVNVQGNVLLKGNVLVNGSSTLAFAASSGSVQFVGSTAQTIGGTAPAGALTFGSSPILLMNNAAGVVLARAITVNKLTLTNGILSTTATNLLTLPAIATLSGGSSSSFVNGPLARVTGAAAATTFFPIGKGTAYRPLTLNATAQTSTTTYTGEVLNASARTTGVDAPLDRVSNIRYATLTPDVQPTGFSGTLTMEFGADDYVTDPQDNTFVMAKRNGAANWVSIGRSSATGTAGTGNVAGTLTSGVFTSFSDFALASTAAAVGNTLGSNPLPVELTAFSAQRQADKAVSVNWTTASERNSARFEVQRSRDGREFATFATAAAQGTSTRATAYAALDKAAPAGTLYYRLRQVDRDGSSSFSPVAIVAGNGEAARVLLYPNPAHNTLRFVAATAQAWRVLNQLGQPLLRGTTEAGPVAITVEALPSGLYFLELQTPAGRVVQKFEKE